MIHSYIFYSWGKYGILSEIDIYTKGEEYSTWLIDVKHLSRDMLGRKEEKEYFKVKTSHG